MRLITVEPPLRNGVGGNTVGSRGQRSKAFDQCLTARARSILVGTLLGDGRLQPTGRCRARLRLEHGLDQLEYLLWKADELSGIAAGRTTYLDRVHPLTRAVYRYVRHQSLASATYGQFWKLFYPSGKKHIPDVLSALLVDPLALAVWYMDDGYYFLRERECYCISGRSARKRPRPRKRRWQRTSQFHRECSISVGKGTPCTSPHAKPAHSPM